jgi:CRISPR-associated endonuclease/helicase Cas3
MVSEIPIWRIPAMNRKLVECATHPLALDVMTGELEQRDRRWRRARQDIDGQQAADACIAQHARLPWDYGFDNDELGFPKDERIGTRLGAHDVLVPLPDGTQGPFGKEIRVLSIPGHWLEGVDLGGELELLVTPRDGALQTRLGDRHFLYDSLGLRRMRQ